MRRKDRLTENEIAIEIVKNNNHGILSCVTPEGFPYGVPLNYAYYDNKLIFHCAQKGQKIECFNNNIHVSFCIIDKAKVLPELFTTSYRSVIISGTLVEVCDEILKKQDLIRLCKANGVDDEEKTIKYMKPYLSQTKVYNINITGLSGKERGE